MGCKAEYEDDAYDSPCICTRMRAVQVTMIDKYEVFSTDQLSCNDFQVGFCNVQMAGG